MACGGQENNAIHFLSFHSHLISPFDLVESLVPLSVAYTLCEYLQVYECVYVHACVGVCACACVWWQSGTEVKELGCGFCITGSSPIGGLGPSKTVNWGGPA